MAELITTEFKGNVAIVWADNPPVNAISRAVRQGLSGAFLNLQNNESVKAIILACRGNTFFAGADITEFDKPPKKPFLQDVFNLIENTDVPVIAALFGTALGGGFEAALACHYRIALRSAKMGLPEVKLGIFPGAGGTQRLPRLVPPEQTLEIILKGKSLSAGQALKLGLIDKIIEANLMNEAEAFAKQLIEQGKTPRKVSKMPPITDGLTSAVAKYEKFIKSRLKGLKYALSALKTIKAAYEKPFVEGLALEKKLNLEAKQTLESKAMRHVFFAERKATKIPGLKASLEPLEIETVGVVGAGTMGRGIAMCFANAGVPVTIVENNQEALKKGLGEIKKTYARGVEKGRLSKTAMNKTLALIFAAPDLTGLEGADLVIEAVFEDMALKKEIFSKLDKICQPEAILATNTSTLNVDKIALATKRPENVLGMHFFSPAHIMPLLEVVRGKKTADRVLSTVLRLGKKIRKKPVVSGVCFGFIGNRMLSPYGREAQRMLLEGASPKDIDKTLEDFGMAMGVLAVYDLAGLDVGHKIRQAMADRGPKDPTFFKASEVLYRQGRFGQKTGAGFYKYRKGSRNRQDDPKARKLFHEAAKELGINQRKIGRDEILERCFYPLINEGAKILEDGIALRAGDIDVVWTSGYGFPRHKGGPMFWADHYGLGRVLAGLKKYRQKFGPEFWQPAPLLEKLVQEQKTFADWDRENI